MSLRSLFLCFQRITIEQIRDDEWFKKSYNPVRVIESEAVNLEDINAAFDDDEVRKSFKFIVLHLFMYFKEQFWSRELLN